MLPCSLNLPSEVESPTLESLSSFRKLLGNDGHFLSVTFKKRTDKNHLFKPQRQLHANHQFFILHL